MEIYRFVTVGIDFSRTLSRTFYQHLNNFFLIVKFPKMKKLGPFIKILNYDLDRLG